MEVKIPKFTPDYEHFLSNKELRSNVYEPEADTFLFLDALDIECEAIAGRLLRRLRLAARNRLAQPDLDHSSTEAKTLFTAVEIGCGSGLVITHLGMLLQRWLATWAKGAAVVEEPLRPSDSWEAEDELVKQSVLLALGEASNEGLSDANLIRPPFANFFFVDINKLAIESASQTWGINLGKQLNALRASKTETEPIATVTRLDSSAETFDVCAYVRDCPSNCLFSCTGILGDLFSPFARARHEQQEEAKVSSSKYVKEFDIVMFNPPYVPTDLEELEKATAEHDILTAAWCGGPKGRVVVDRFFQNVFDLLRPIPTVVLSNTNDDHPPSLAAGASGLLYVVAIKENDVADMCNFANDCFCDSDAARVEREGGKLQFTDGKEEPVILEAALACSTVTERWTGEHLSILKLEMVPEVM